MPSPPKPKRRQDPGSSDDLLAQLLSCVKQRDAAWDALSELHAAHMVRSHIEPAQGPSLCKPCEIHARGLGDTP